MFLSADRWRADLLTELQGAGLKVTPQRRAIVEALAGDDTHPTAQELFDRLSAAHPTISFATVYNTLGMLVRLGRVQALAHTGAATRYDPRAVPHDHAVCDRCGAVEDMPAADGHGMASAKGFRIRQVERIYRGVCAMCHARQAAPETGR